MALLGVLSLFFILNPLAEVDASYNKPSTAGLKDIVIGRCKDYLDFRWKNPVKPNCDTIWKKFHDSFAFKDPCNLTFDDYKPFFNATRGGDHDIVDKALFWSGTKDVVHYYSNVDLRFTTLEDTFVGSMMNELSWCGNSSLPNTTDGIDYQSCPKCDITTAFWGQASKRFAERTRGIIRVMLNGTRTNDTGYHVPAYRNTSYFGKYELPSLRVNNIKKLIILVIHSIGKKIIESCGIKSIKQLESDAKARHLKVECVDDPEDVRHLLCIDHAKTEECQFLDFTEQTGIWKVISIAFIVLFILMFVVIVILVICLYKKRSSVTSRSSKEMVKNI